MEMLPPAPSVIVDCPLADEVDEDDQSVTSAALGIESSATSFTGGMTVPRHVLLELDDDGDLQSFDGDSTMPYDDSGDGTVDYEGDGGAPTTTSSRFWGVSWHQPTKKWLARYKDANGKQRHLGSFDDEEEAARAVNNAIRDAGLARRRRMDAVDATGALVPRERTYERGRSAVVAPDPVRAPTATTSKFWGVTWDKGERRWRAQYQDANKRGRTIGYFDTQEEAAHAVNAAIRRAGLEGRRKTNPVVDGHLVPRVRNAPGQGRRPRKRRRDEPAAAPSTRARRR